MSLIPPPETITGVFLDRVSQYSKTPKIASPQPLGPGAQHGPPSWVLSAPLGSNAPQVYMFLVKWQDLSEKVVYRKFTEIYEFHVSVGGGAGSSCRFASAFVDLKLSMYLNSD